MATGVTSQGHQQRLLVMPDDGEQAVLDLLASAKKSLRIKQFKLQAPAVIKAMQDAHERGVKVQIMLNPHTSGGDRWNDEAFELFKKSGVDVRWTSESFPVTHEKSIVVDDEFALVATFNLAEKYFTLTRDHGLVTYNQNAVRQVIAGFDADWNNLEFKPDLTVGLVWSNLHSRGQIAKVIDSSTTHLWIQHPKFVDAVILDRIVEACVRGVKVHLLCGGKHGISDWDIYDTFGSLRVMSRFGVKIRRQKHLKLHTKMIIVDKKSAVIGSMNIDRSAFDIRRELGMETDAPEVIERCCQTFEADWHEAKDYLAPDPLDPSLHDHGELSPDPNFIHE